MVYGRPALGGTPSCENSPMDLAPQCDLLVVGGGIHGTAVARDAAGRGLSVVLAEQYDLAAATSMASSKLIHGGLRYLEQGELRLVREALRERELLLTAAPHLARPLRFILPLGTQSRPAWQVRVGLWLYDLIAGTSRLPRSRSLDLTAHAELGLREAYRRGLSYSDAWGDDARLVVANARDAADRGARISTRTRCERLQPEGRGWSALLVGADGAESTLLARAVVNATGPWVARFLATAARVERRTGVRLVKGSHLVLQRRLPERTALLLQNQDGRVVFAMPFERDFCLLGTTDVALAAPPTLVDIDPDEINYLKRVFAAYFTTPIADAEILWTFAGVRALYDDGTRNPSQVTREYRLEVDRAVNGAPVLSVIGGKLTTARKLAERVVDRIAAELSHAAPAWTAGAVLPGGDIENADLARFESSLMQRYPRIPGDIVRDVAGRHGTIATQILSAGNVGTHFGAGLTAAEIDYLVEREWAQSADDVLYRRTKCGVRITPAQRAEVERYVQEKRGR